MVPLKIVTSRRFLFAYKILRRGRGGEDGYRELAKDGYREHGLLVSVDDRTTPLPVLFGRGVSKRGLTD